MNKIKIKINGYDEESNSLLVSFASDETQSQDPASYQSFAYQPMTMWPDVTDLEEIKKRLAQAGIYIADQQRIKEQFIADPAKIDAYKAMVGEILEFNISDITTPSTPSTPTHSNEVNV
jgi:hypothetical protein